jgi:undecaprenyl-diphosphatase
MSFITHLGDLGFIWIATAAILIAKRDNKKYGLMLLCAIILTTILGEGILKNLIRRLRPCTEALASKLLISKPITYSFPSGHTASSFAAAIILAKISKVFGISAFCMASLISYSRVYLRVHYPTDIVGGIILGVICSDVVMYVFNQGIINFC